MTDRMAVVTRNTDTEPKYVHLADQLTTRLRTGEWDSGKVPTVREIASVYGVSSFTASRALHLLQDRGLVVNRDRSGCYVVNGVANDSKTSQWAIVLRMTPGPWRESAEAGIRIGFERLSAANNFKVIPFPSEQSGPVRPQALEQLAREVASSGVQGLFFMPSRISEEACRNDEMFLAACQEAGLSIVLIDRNLRGENRPLEFDLVASDHFDGGVRCTEHLIKSGRKAVAGVVSSPTSTHNDRLAGYLFALHTIGGGARPHVLRLPEELDDRAEYPWIADALQECGADSLICYHDYTAVGLTLELLRRGVNVPRDIAVVGCDDLPIGNSFSLGITTYTYPAIELAAAAVRAMCNRLANPADPPIKVLLPGRLLVRESSQIPDPGSLPPPSQIQ